MVHPFPWEVEEALINNLSLPLNVQGNSHHSFCQTLRAIRAAAKESARAMPISLGRGDGVQGQRAVAGGAGAQIWPRNDVRDTDAEGCRQQDRVELHHSRLRPHERASDDRRHPRPYGS